MRLLLLNLNYLRYQFFIKTMPKKNRILNTLPLRDRITSNSQTHKVDKHLLVCLAIFIVAYLNHPSPQLQTEKSAITESLSQLLPIHFMLGAFTKYLHLRVSRKRC